MKKIALTLIFTILLAAPPVSFAKEWNEIFSVSGNVKGQMLKGTGSIIDDEKFAEMTTTGDYEVISGNKKYKINSIYGSYGTYADGNISYQVNYYTALNANSGPDIFVISGTTIDNKISVNGVRESEFKVLKREKRITDIETSGKTENLPTPEGEGVHYLYTTDWNNLFDTLEKKLIKISTTYTDGVGYYLNVFTYKKGGFENYKNCLKNKAMPFCFKKEGEKLIMAAKSQLGENVNFWILGGKNVQLLKCPKGMKKFIEKNDGYQFCYPKHGKVEKDKDSTVFASPNDKNLDTMGGITIKEFYGTPMDYLKTMELEGVISNIETFKNKMGLKGTLYEFGSGGAGEWGIIFQKPGTKMLYLLVYGFADAEDQEFLKALGDYFSFTK